MLKVTLNDVISARETIASAVASTPLIHSHPLSLHTGAETFLKLENLLQPVGSFKLRGAYNKFSSLTAEEKAKGAITVSAGNHAQAVAWCAKQFGVDAVIFMPENTPQIKIENTKRFGSMIVLAGRDYDDSERQAHEYEQLTGRTFIHPFHDSAIMAGQGTVALEILDAVPDVETLVVPVGGGGLICGMAAAAKAVNPKIKVIGVQPESSAPFLHALRAGRYVKTDIGDSVADALTGDILSEELFELFKSLVDDVVALPEKSLERGIWWMLKNHGMAIEGGAAAGISALLDSAIKTPHAKTAVVITGCGIQLDRLFKIVNKFDGQ